MKDKEYSQQSLDALLKAAAIIANENISREIKDNGQEIEFSKEHEEKMRRFFKRERRKELTRKLNKYFKVAACAVAAVFVVSSISIFSVDAWRVKFLNFVFDSEKANTDFNFTDGSGTSYSDDEITLGYIPEGYSLVEKTAIGDIVTLYFSNDIESFTFVLNTTEGDLSTDTEGGYIDKVTVNGREAIYSSNKNTNILMWHDNNYMYSINGSISKEEMIKIAENVKK